MNRDKLSNFLQLIDIIIPEIEKFLPALSADEITAYTQNFYRFKRNIEKVVTLPADMLNNPMLSQQLSSLLDQTTDFYSKIKNFPTDTLLNYKNNASQIALKKLFQGLFQEFDSIENTIIEFYKLNDMQKKSQNPILPPSEIPVNKELSDIKKTLKDLSKTAHGYSVILTNLENKFIELKQLSDTDLNTIAKAISAGKEELSHRALGDSFSTRSRSLDKTSQLWLVAVFGLILLVIFDSALTIYINNGIPDNFDILNLHIRKFVFYVPIFLVSFWGLWFCCKQYAYSCRLRDDYHYKYDLSTAFYGYNEEVKKLAGDDKTIQLALLDIVIKNIGKNPADSNPLEMDCNSPYTEGFKKLHELMTEANKLVNNVKGSSSDKKKNDDSTP